MWQSKWEIAAFVFAALLITLLIWLVFGGKSRRPAPQKGPAKEPEKGLGKKSGFWNWGEVSWLFVALAILTSTALVFLVPLALIRRFPPTFQWIKGVGDEYSSSIGLACLVIALGTLGLLAQPLVETKKDVKEKAK